LDGDPSALARTPTRFPNPMARNDQSTKKLEAVSYRSKDSRFRNWLACSSATRHREVVTAARSEPTWGTPVWLVALVAAVYFAAAEIGLSLAFVAEQVTAVW